jgi:hypothetical protein
VLLLVLSQEMVHQMVGFMWEPLIAAVKKEPETDLAASMLDSLAGVCGGGQSVYVHCGWNMGVWVACWMDWLCCARLGLSLCGSGSMRHAPL